jgi:thioesterase domain-containing protein
VGHAARGAVLLGVAQQAHRKGSSVKAIVFLSAFSRIVKQLCLY